MTSLRSAIEPAHDAGGAVSMPWALPALLISAASAVFAACGTGKTAHAAARVSTEWTFTALLDGEPIGTHRFVLEDRHDDEPGTRIVAADARFDVKVLGFTVYRYRHSVREQWQGDCLRSLVAHTNDGGSITEVRGGRSSGTFAIDVSPPGADGRTTRAAGDCLMTFAYWNPALRAQRQLLDPSSGRIEPVRFAPLDEGTIDVRGKAVRARGWRILGLAHPIDVWYAGDRWIGLDTSVGENRRLSYRLQ